MLASGKTSGFRNDPSGRFTDRRYYSRDQMRRAGHPPTDHQVFLAHGGNSFPYSVIDGASIE